MKKRKIKTRKCKITIKELDGLVRDIVRIRDKMTCQRCGRKSPYKLEVAHFISRSNHAVRWDLDNVCLLCFNCHYNFAHKDPAGFNEWIKEKLGKERYEALRLRANGKAGDKASIALYLENEKRKLTMPKWI